MMRKPFVALGIVSIALVLAAYVVSGWKSGEAPPTSDLLKEAKPAAILDYIRSLNAPLVMVNFWASWCEPCKKEFPHILSLKESLASDGFRVVFVSIDNYREIRDAESFLQSNGITTPSFYRGSQSADFVTGIFPKWEGAVPASVLFNNKMEIVDSWEGEATIEEFKKHILPHLRGT